MIQFIQFIKIMNVWPICPELNYSYLKLQLSFLSKNLLGLCFLWVPKCLCHISLRHPRFNGPPISTGYDTVTIAGALFWRLHLPCLARGVSSNQQSKQCLVIMWPYQIPLLNYWGQKDKEYLTLSPRIAAYVCTNTLCPFILLSSNFVWLILSLLLQRVNDFNTCW